MKQPKPKAYSYIRMSTDIQIKGDSLRRQLSLSEKYSNQHGLELVQTLQDLGVSAYQGKNSKGGALGVFIDALEASKIPKGSYLLVESLDRLSRESVLVAFKQFTSILEFGVTIVTLSDGQVYTHERISNDIGQLFTSLGIMLRANEESRIKSDRLKASWENKRSNLNNKIYTSVAPAWLVYNDKKKSFVVNERIAKTVRKVFEMSIQGYGNFAICGYLNKNIETYPPITKVKGWHKSYIQKTLNNIAVFGAFQAHKTLNGVRVKTGDIVRNYYPIVVSEEDFNLSQARVAQRKINGAGRKGLRFSNIFMRMVRCGNCGAVVGYSDKGDPPKGGKYLHCSNAERSHGCSAPSWNYDEFESSFFEFVNELNLEEIFSSEDSKKTKENLLRELDIFENNLKELSEDYKQMLDKILRAPESLFVDLTTRADLLKGKIAFVNDSIQGVNNQIAELDKRPSSILLKENIKSYQQMIETKSPEEIKAIRQKIHNYLKQFINEIRLNNNDKFLPSDSLEAMCSRELLDGLDRKGFKSNDEKEKYLLSATGARFFSYFNRNYLVIFRTGAKRYVQPAKKITINFNKLQL